MGQDNSIQYCSGKFNVATNALSRISEPSSSTLLLLSIPCLTFLEELKQNLLQDQAFLQLRQAILNEPKAYPHYVIAQDLILKGGCIWLPQGSSFTSTLLMEYHSSPIGGHMRVAKTLARLSENFTWPGIRKDAEHFVVECIDCQHTKYKTIKVVGLLCPLSVPFQPWEDLSLDFIVDLLPFHYLGGRRPFFERNPSGHATHPPYITHRRRPIHGYCWEDSRDALQSGFRSQPVVHKSFFGKNCSC